MSPDFITTLFTLPGALASAATGVWLWMAIACPANLGGVGPFSSGDKKQTNVTTSIQDSFNESNSTIDSLSDSGNSTLNIGNTGNQSDPIGQYGPFLLVALLALGGIALLTR